ncbi:MAG: hypothetical protein KH100_04790 [Dysgonomonas mossii]|uniref:hypothetical protein n=1 Tax=Dysgonomonas mossii TaxID=163665 RepID=UPI001D90F367|nr:hypothetical protein [Dysgonomonas mossii]MBS5795624.1 hypothetical protein [Dysgonomonas mossii]MBS7110503.1 hypothetical protein [Dysgonomonas mossii]
MADKRKYEIQVESNIEPVKQLLTVIKSVDTSHKDLGETLKDVIKIEQEAVKAGNEKSEKDEQIAKRRAKNSEKVTELYRAISTQEHSHIENAAKMLEQSHQVTAKVSEISDLNQESYKLLMKNNQEKAKAIQEEIDGLTKNAKSVVAVTEAYKKKKEIIEEQAIIAQAEAEASYNVQIEKAKLAGKNVVALEEAKAEQVKRINEELGKDLKKNSEEYSASFKGVYNKLVSSLSENAEIFKDTTSKSTKELMKSTATEAAEMLGISDETTQAIIKAAIEAQEKAKEATAGVKSTEETAKTATAEVKKTGEEAAKTAEATKKIVDIDATRKNIEKIKLSLEEYRSMLKDASEKRIKGYDEELEAAGDNAEKRKEIETRKAQYMEEFTQELLILNQTKNQLEKKEQDLGILQWKQYAQKAEEIAGSIKGITDQISGALGSAFTAVSKAYDAEIASWDEKIKHLKNKNAEVSKEIENQGKKVAALEAAQKNASAAGLEKRAEELATSLKAEKEIYQEQLKNKEELEKKEREYERRKAKEQAKKEKIEKLNRKASLIKNIGEATVNVAQGITKTLGAYPWPLNLALATIVGAAGAVQIGIMTKQLAKFQDGGLLHGKRHSQGGMRIEGTNMEVEGGEFVVNRVSTDKNLGLVKYINEQRRELKPKDLDAFFARSSQGLEPSFKRMFAQGGQLPTIEPATNVDNDSLIKAIQAIKIEPKVAVTDIHRAQDNMVSVSGWSGV